MLVPLFVVLLGAAHALPIVDPGLFVILGVRTCGGGDGYCLLGSDCTLDRDFAHDDVGGHCDGLRFAFTPAAHFVCCKYVERSNTTLPGEPGEFVTTENPADNLIETDGQVKQAGTSATPEDSIPKTGTEASTEALPSSDVETEGLRTVVVGEERTTTSPDGPQVSPQEPDHANAVEPESLELESHVAVSEVYKVKSEAAAASHTNESHETVDGEEANVVPVEDLAHAPDIPKACFNSTDDVNPCWRTSFVDKNGVVLCSGSLIGLEAAVTTAVCANRLQEAGLSAVTMRVSDATLALRGISVHPDYLASEGGSALLSDHSDIALVRLLPAPASSNACIACLPQEDTGDVRVDSKTCFALAARLGGAAGVDSSAVCQGTVSVASSNASLLKLNGCEVPSLKSAAVGNPLAVQAREGASLLCDGLLVGLASTSTASYSALAPYRSWLSRTLSLLRNAPVQS